MCFLQIVHMGWVCETGEGGTTFGSSAFRFLALRGSHFYIFRSPPVRRRLFKCSVRNMRDNQISESVLLAAVITLSAAGSDEGSETELNPQVASSHLHGLSCFTYTVREIIGELPDLNRTAVLGRSINVA